MVFLPRLMALNKEKPKGFITDQKLKSDHKLVPSNEHFNTRSAAGKFANKLLRSVQA